MSLSTILWVFLALTGGLALAMLATVALGRSLLRRRLRLHPKHKSRVPSLWLASPRSPARAHRRLRLATSRARYEAATIASASGTADPAHLADTLDQLHQRAFELERVLLSTARAPFADRHRAMTAVWGEINRIEQNVQLLSGATAAWRNTVMSPETLGGDYLLQDYSVMSTDNLRVVGQLTQPQARTTPVERIEDVAEKLTRIKTAS
jgi:hypothetical protein